MDIAYILLASMCCNVLLCGFNSEQCVPPNVSSDGTFIDGALYCAYFILTVNMWLQNYQCVDFMDLVTYPVELECAGRALQMDAATEKKVKIINF